MHFLQLKLHLKTTRHSFMLWKKPQVPRIHDSVWKSHTWRALILLWTFSWDKTLEGSGSVRSSARKMLSWDNARDPIAPWEHLRWRWVQVTDHDKRTETWIWNETLADTHCKSSSDPNSFPAVMSLADLLSLSVSSVSALLVLPKRRLFRDLRFGFLPPDRDWDRDRSRSKQLTESRLHVWCMNCSSPLFPATIWNYTTHLECHLYLLLYLRRKTPLVRSLTKKRKTKRKH